MSGRYKLAALALAAGLLFPWSHASAAQRDQHNEERAVEPTTAIPGGQPTPSVVGKDNDGEDEAAPLSEIVVTARRLDAARAAVEPSLGASSYALSNDAVEGRPGGETANLVHVLLQMPGVTQTGSGEVRLRSQANLQYRINNVIVPEGFSDLADTLRARFADQVELITGALPAQYGLQVGGVVNVTSKNGVYEHGGDFELYGSSLGHREIALEKAGSTGRTNFDVSGSYVRDDVGLSSRDGSRRPLHDQTREADGFVFVDHIIDTTSRLSLIAGTTDERFQLPTVRDLNAATFNAPATFRRPLQVRGVISFPSEQQTGDERNNAQYAILSYQRTSERATRQVSGFAAYSTLTVDPDPMGDLLFTGLSQAVHNIVASAGLQAESVYDLSPEQTLRAGLVASWRREANKAQFVALPADMQGRQTSGIPLELVGRAVEHRAETSVFAEDEWRTTKDVTVNFGLRFDDISGDGGGNRVSPRVNAVWVSPSGTSVHAGYARYFVPAPADEEAGWPTRLIGTTGAAPGLSADKLRAETDDYFDVGVQQGVGNLTLGLDVYWREATNLLDEVRVGAGSLRRPFNFREGRARGVEFSATYDRGPFSAWGNLAVSRAEGREIISGQAPFTASELAATAANFVPTNQDQRYTGSAGAAYRWGALRVSVDAIYGSGLPRTSAGGSPNSGRLPGYVQVNMSAVYRVDGLRDRPLDLRLDLINALDRKYEIEGGTSLAGGAARWGPRLCVLVGLEQQF